jgi:hypothetical protein
MSSEARYGGLSAFSGLLRLRRGGGLWKRYGNNGRSAGLRRADWSTSVGRLLPAPLPSTSAEAAGGVHEESARTGRRPLRSSPLDAGGRPELPRTRGIASSQDGSLWSEAVASTFEYDEDDWAKSAGHRPLEGVNINQVFLLHRHWIWANLQRARFDETLGQAPKPDDGAFLADVSWASMLLWYGLLWSVIEGFEERRIEIRGLMRADIDYVGDTLRRCRNVVFHVSSKDQNDPRLYGLMQLPESAAAIRRISTGFGRMFIEESQARKASGEIPSD